MIQAYPGLSLSMTMEAGLKFTYRLWGIVGIVLKIMFSWPMPDSMLTEFGIHLGLEGCEKIFSVIRVGTICISSARI